MGKKILLSGITCLDVITYVPEYPVEDGDYRGVDQAVTLGGNVTNSAKVLAQLGAEAQLFTAIPSNHTIYEELAVKFRIDVTRCLTRPAGAIFPITVCLVNTVNGSRTLFYPGRGVIWPSADDFIKEFPSFDGYSWLHFEIVSCFQYAQLLRMAQHAVACRSKASQADFTISMELEHPVPSEWLHQLLPLADVIFASKDFAQSRGWSSMEEAAEGLPNALDAAHATVICPWGEKGVAGRSPNDGETVVVPAHAPASGRVVDTLAAGDCFNAVCIHELNEGRTLREALERAVWITGEKVGKRGLDNLDLGDNVAR